jgi:hypothetical protein
MIDPKLLVYELQSKMSVAEPSERQNWSTLGIRRLMRQSGLSQKTVYSILAGKPVRRYTLFSFRQAADKINI